MDLSKVVVKQQEEGNYGIIFYCLHGLFSI